MKRFLLASLSALMTLATPAVAQPGPAPGVPDLLERVAGYLATFEKDYARVIADERYRQTLKEKRIQVIGDKTVNQVVEIRSDILASPDLGNRWLSFRDVYSVNGRQVRDRDTRLQKIFETAGANRLDEARRIADEGARFNLGTVSRNINLPAMPLTFLTSENRARSAFRNGGHELVGNVDAIVLEFQETARPTLVRSGSRDLPAQGKVWIEPASGRILKASVRFEGREFTTEMTVTFGLVEKLKMWVPVEMKDSSENAKETVTGLATYTNYRRFDTSVVIK